MTFTIDHVVIGVYDLGQAVTDYRAAGFNVIPGGRHADGLTHNALIVFQDGTLPRTASPDFPNAAQEQQYAGEGIPEAAPAW